MSDPSDAGTITPPAGGISPGVRVRVRPSGERGDPFGGRPGTVTWTGRMGGSDAILEVAFDAGHLRKAIFAFDEVDLIE